MQNGEKYWDFVLIARYRWRDKLDLDLTSLRWETGRGWKGDSEKDEELIGPSLGRDNFIHGFDRSFIELWFSAEDCQRKMSELIYIGESIFETYRLQVE